MPQWPHVMPALLQLGCDGPHVPSVEFLLPVVRMVPWELAILWTSGTFGFLTKPVCLARIASCYLVFFLPLVSFSQASLPLFMGFYLSHLWMFSPL